MIEIIVIALLIVFVFAAYKLHVIGAILAEAKLLIGSLKDDINRAINRTPKP